MCPKKCTKKRKCSRKVSDSSSDSSSSSSDSEDDKKKISKARPSKTSKKPSESKKKKKDSDSSSKKSSSDSDKKESEKKIVKAVKKGAVAVDIKFEKASKYHVYDDGKGKIYNASMMLSDLKDNHNKYYIIQLLQADNSSSEYILWTRWGRVGVDGQTLKSEFSSAEMGIKAYEKKFKDKTRVGYATVEISYDEESKGEAPTDTENDKGKNKKESEEDSKNADKKEEKPAESKLDKRVQELIKLIFNMKMMQQQMTEIGYDAKKLPLGKLSKETIKKGYEVLKKIADQLDEVYNLEKLLDLSSDFYTTIPHDFGYK